NAMREIEVFLPLTFLMASSAAGADPIAGWVMLLGLLWTGGFALFPLFNRDRLRVGDFVAGTWVVKSPREKLTIDLLDALEAAQGASGQGGYVFTPDQASAYGIKELHVLEDVLRRKDAKTMQAVAERIRAKIGWRLLPEETDVGFLSAYYAALRGRLETRLLFGHRRKDKYDKA
ncbi:MAG TPA: RDD family protein, partial [Caulobacteraceae bacterium]|nr:RDD family protein [Caulobacteraceae bacterium]